MDLLHAKYVKFVAAGGDLDAAAQRTVVLDSVSEKRQSGKIHENITSVNPNPEDRIEIGKIYEVKFILEDGIQDDIASLEGGTNISAVYTAPQTNRVLPKFDVRVCVFRKSDNAEHLRDYTNMNAMVDVEEKSDQGKQVYLPVTFKSTATSIYSRDNSAV